MSEAEDLAVTDLIPKEALDRIKFNFGKPSAKVIAEVIYNLGKLHERGEIEYDLSKSVSLIEDYAQSQIQELREKVEGLEFERDYNGISEHYRRGNDACVDYVLQIIDKLQEEQHNE